MMEDADTTALATSEGPPSPIKVLARRCSCSPSSVVPHLKNTVLKPQKRKDGTLRHATDSECFAFIVVANEYDLNPFIRQIHGFVGDGGVVPIVGIDGWAALVNRQDGFDGCDFEEDRDEGGALQAVTCTMYHKNRRHPVRVRELMSECRRGTAPWNQMPSRMLRHKAFMQAARLCFGLSGIYDEDEGRDIIRNVSEPPPTREVGVLDVDALSEGEPNRGHGNEGFPALSPQKQSFPSPEDDSPPPDIPQEPPAPSTGDESPTGEAAVDRPCFSCDTINRMPKDAVWDCEGTVSVAAKDQEARRVSLKIADDSGSSVIRLEAVSDFRSLKWLEKGVRVICREIRAAVVDGERVLLASSVDKA